MEKEERRGANAGEAKPIQGYGLYWQSQKATQLVGHRQDDSRLGRAGNMAGHISRRHMRQEQAQY